MLSALRPALACVCVLLASAPLSFAWGTAGHHIVAMIAEQRLSPEVLARTQQLLFDNQYTLADISACPDALRAAESHPLRIEDEYCGKIAGEVRKGTGPWHYIDIPVPTPPGHQPLSTWCPGDNCVTGAIESFRNQMKNSLDDGKRREALMYLVHFMADIHQPLHAAERGCDQGGNRERVNFYGKDGEAPNITLHAAWDTEEVVKSMRDAHFDEERLYAEFLLRSISSSKAAAWRQATVADMAWESHFLATRYAYRGIPDFTFCGLTPPFPVMDPVDLSSRYERDGAHVARERLMMAGVRLADLIEKNLVR